jgi:ERCC4-type nuclease
MEQGIHIIVDDRELPSGVLSELSRLHEVSTELRRLPLGDYDVDGRLLFERKTLTDLVASIKDGRLFSQACRLVKTDRLAAIILEGTTRDLDEIGMRREAIQGALVNLTVFLGIPLLRALDIRETVRLMMFAARQGRAIANGALPRHGRRYRGKRQLQLHILQGLPGVGPRRAALLLERFANVEAVMQAGVEELLSVDGIGRATADMIRWAVKEGAGAYQTPVEGEDLWL